MSENFQECLDANSGLLERQHRIFARINLINSITADIHNAKLVDLKKASRSVCINKILVKQVYFSLASLISKVLGHKKCWTLQ